MLSKGIFPRESLAATPETSRLVLTTADEFLLAVLVPFMAFLIVQSAESFIADRAFVDGTIVVNRQMVLQCVQSSEALIASWAFKDTRFLRSGLRKFRHEHAVGLHGKGRRESPRLWSWRRKRLSALKRGEKRSKHLLFNYTATSQRFQILNRYGSEAASPGKPTTRINRKRIGRGSPGRIARTLTTCGGRNPPKSSLAVRFRVSDGRL